MSTDIPTVKELFKAGAHFGHLRSKTDARTHSFVYTFKNRIAVINLDETVKQLKEATDFLDSQAKNGALILFSGTKIQAKDKIKEIADKLKMPYVNERWPGGLITNFKIVSKSIKKMVSIEKDLFDKKYEHLTKNERLKIEKGLEKSKIIFDGLRDLDRVPDVVFVVDAKEEEIAILEARTKNIPVVALCDTNANPRIVDYPIIVNDDSKKTIAIILDVIAKNFSKSYKPRATGQDVENRVEKVLIKKPESINKAKLKKGSLKNDGKNKKS